MACTVTVGKHSPATFLYYHSLSPLSIGLMGLTTKYKYGKALCMLSRVVKSLQMVEMCANQHAWGTLCPELTFGQLIPSIALYVRVCAHGCMRDCVCTCVSVCVSACVYTYVCKEECMHENRERHRHRSPGETKAPSNCQ